VQSCGLLAEHVELEEISPRRACHYPSASAELRDILCCASTHTNPYISVRLELTSAHLLKPQRLQLVSMCQVHSLDGSESPCRG
jgi:hypothetical protein